jgi:hypothetical protein
MVEKEQRRAIFYTVSMDDSDPEALMGVEEDTKGFDSFRFYNGEWIEDWPAEITFSYAEGEHAEDRLLGIPHWVLVSERVRQVFLRHQIRGVQFLPIKAIHKKTGKEVGKYWALNVVQEIEALDWTHTLWTTTDLRKIEKHAAGYILREALLWEPLRNIDIFRLKVQERGLTIFISARLKQWLKEAGATSGFSFFPIPAY